MQNRQVTGFKIMEDQGHDPLENFDTNFSIKKDLGHNL